MQATLNAAVASYLLPRRLASEKSPENKEASHWIAIWHAPCDYEERNQDGRPTA